MPYICKRTFWCPLRIAGSIRLSGLVFGWSGTLRELFALELKYIVHTGKLSHSMTLK